LERKVGPRGLTLPTGHTFPPGTVVGVNAWPLGRDIEVFGDNVHEFDPHRWLRGPNETKSDFDDRVNRMNRASTSFGWGPRGCLGKNVAYLLIYKVIATLFKEFEVPSRRPFDSVMSADR
jgi:cytochrome P450